MDLVYSFHSLFFFPSGLFNFRFDISRCSCCPLHYDLFTKFDFSVVFMPVLWRQSSLKALYFWVVHLSIHPIIMNVVSQESLEGISWHKYLLKLRDDLIRIWWSNVISQTSFGPEHKNSDTHFAQMSHRMN